MSNWADFQYEIYLNGLTGAVPRLPTDLTRLEELAEHRLGPGPVGYVAGSAGDGKTERANRDALDRRQIVPRMLRDVQQRDLSVDVLGRQLPAPLAPAPVGVLSIMHPDAKSAAARPRPPGHPVHLLLRVQQPDGAGRRGDGGRRALVPAVLVQGPRGHPQLPQPRQGCRVHRALRHPGHPDARLAATRPRPGVPAVPARRRHRQLLHRPGVPGVVDAVGGRLTVLFDSGIRTGDDVFKALALGARAVLLGRPYAYALGLDGQAGVEHVIRSLLAEFDLTLALSGYATPGELGPEALTQEST